MKNMKHGGKARKTHKRMQGGGMAGYGAAARPMAYSKGKPGTSAFLPVGRPDFIPSPGVGGNLKPGMLPLASSEAYMRRPGRGGASGSGMGGARPMPRPIESPVMDKGPAIDSNYAMARPVMFGKGAPASMEAAAPAFRKGGAVKGKRMAAGGMAYSKGKPGTHAHRPVAGGTAGPRAMRGGGLARKGVGMALAKGGLAKRAGGCAKRGVGRGKMV